MVVNNYPEGYVGNSGVSPSPSSQPVTTTSSTSTQAIDNKPEYLKRFGDRPLTGKEYASLSRSQKRDVPWRYTPYGQRRVAKRKARADLVDAEIAFQEDASERGFTQTSNGLYDRTIPGGVKETVDFNKQTKTQVIESKSASNIESPSTIIINNTSKNTYNKAFPTDPLNTFGTKTTSLYYELGVSPKRETSPVNVLTSADRNTTTGYTTTIKKSNTEYNPKAQTVGRTLSAQETITTEQEVNTAVIDPISNAQKEMQGRIDILNERISSAYTKPGIATPKEAGGRLLALGELTIYGVSSGLTSNPLEGAYAIVTKPKETTTNLYEAFKDNPTYTTGQIGGGLIQGKLIGIGYTESGIKSYVDLVKPTINIRTIQLPQETGTPVNIRTLSVEQGGRSFIVGALKDTEGTRATVFRSAPGVVTELKNLPISGNAGEGIRISNPTETKILQTGLKNVEPEYLESPTRATEFIPVTQNIIRKTYNTQSAFKKGFSGGTEYLDPQATKIVLDIAKEEKGFVSGSFSRSAQLADNYEYAGTQYTLSKVPKDIDIHLDGTPENIQAVAEKTLKKLQESGYDVRLKGEGGVVQNAIEIKQADGTYGKAVEFLGEGAIPDESIPPDMVVGFNKAGKKIVIDGVTSTSLAEELRGTIQGSARLRRIKSDVPGDILYHGTPFQNSNNILNEGLKTSGDLGYTYGSLGKKIPLSDNLRSAYDTVSTTKSLEEARSYAGDNGVVLEVFVPKDKVLFTDRNLVAVKGNIPSENIRIFGTDKNIISQTTKLDIYPREGRVKDISSVSVSARTLQQSKLLDARGLQDDIVKFESLYPEDIVRSQVTPVNDVVKVDLADFRSTDYGLPTIPTVSNSGFSAAPNSELSNSAIKNSELSNSQSSEYSISTSPEYSISSNSTSPSNSVSESSFSTDIKVSPSSIEPPATSQFSTSTSSPSLSISNSPYTPNRSVSKSSLSKPPKAPVPSEPSSIDAPSVPTNKKGKGKRVQLFVRKKGKFELKGTFENPGEAFKTGIKETSTTARASFKTVYEGEKKSFIAGVLPEQFRRSKKDEFVVVQKAPFRISDYGEKRELQQAKKAKRLL